MRARLILGAANLALAGLHHALGGKALGLAAAAAIIGGLLLLTTLVDRLWLVRHPKAAG